MSSLRTASLTDEQKTKIAELNAEAERLNMTMLRDESGEVIESARRPCQHCEQIKAITYQRVWSKAEPVGSIQAICEECNGYFAAP